MLFAVSEDAPANRLAMRLCFHAFILTLYLSFTLLSTHAEARSRPIEKNQFAESVANNAPNPDLLLLEAYQFLANNQLLAAQRKIDELLDSYPNFQLAHLIRGDLLLMHTKPVNGLGAGSNATPDKLKELRDEAAARLKSLRERPQPDLIPRAVLQIREDQKQIIVIDAKKSRLYLYENKDGQPKFVTDFYVSHGKFGINKFKEGDQKTPIGVYYITSRLSGSKLPDFYGPGALPLNYPNEWDRINGRSGSGIWLHGTPSGTFSRPPLASDGCVVLTNPDFLKIAATVDIGKTPVIISEQVEFINQNKWNTERQFANKLLEDWRLDLESLNSNRIFADYSRNFKTAQGEDLNTWFFRQKQLWEGWTNPTIRLRDITHFRYPGKDEMIVSTFTQDISSGKTTVSTRKRQYWLKEASKWRIIFESNV